MPVKIETSVFIKKANFKKGSQKNETIRKFERMYLKKILTKKGNLLERLTYYSENKLN